MALQVLEGDITAPQTKGVSVATLTAVEVAEESCITPVLQPRTTFCAVCTSDASCSTVEPLVPGQRAAHVGATVPKSKCASQSPLFNFLRNEHLLQVVLYNFLVCRIDMHSTVLSPK